MASTTQQEAPRIMRMAEVIKLTGYGRASIYNFMSAGSFPQSKKLGLRAVGWSSHEVQAWIDARLNDEEA